MALITLKFISCLPFQIRAMLVCEKAHMSANPRIDFLLSFIRHLNYFPLDPLHSWSCQQRYPTTFPKPHLKRLLLLRDYKSAKIPRSCLTSDFTTYTVSSLATWNSRPVGFHWFQVIHEVCRPFRVFWSGILFWLHKFVWAAAVRSS